jgi:talin
LHPNVTLPEQGVTEDETVLLKKKFFFNDANVDRSDPVQLHLLYVQVRTPLSYFFVI